MNRATPRLSLHRLPLRAPWVSRRGAAAERWSLIVQAGDAAARGFGEAALPLRVSDPQRVAGEAVAALPATLPLDPARAAPLLDGVPGWLRHGVLSALVDASARRAGTSFAAHLVHSFPASDPAPRAIAPEVSVNANLGPLEPAEAARAATGLVADGFRAIKLKSLGVVDDDVARIRAVRDAVGTGVRLRLDANGAWSPSTAQAVLTRLARLELEYVEQPVESPDVTTARRLVETGTPVAWDESVTDPEAAAWLADSGASVLVVKPPRTAGPDQALAIFRAAAARGVDCVVSTPLEGVVGRTVDLHLAALAGDGRAHGLATGQVIEREYAEPTVGVSGGRLVVPPGPGLGVAFVLHPGVEMAWGGTA